MSKTPVQAADKAMGEFKMAAKGILAQRRAQNRAEILKMKAKLAAMERNADTEEKAMFDLSSDPASTTTHAKIVLGATIMGLVMNDNAAEGSLAHSVREYLERTMPRNSDRKLFGFAPITAAESKSIRSKRQAYIAAMQGSSSEQGNELYADKNSQTDQQTLAQQDQPINSADMQQGTDNAEIQTTLFDLPKNEKENEASSNEDSWF